MTQSNVKRFIRLGLFLALITGFSFVFIAAQGNSSRTQVALALVDPTISFTSVEYTVNENVGSGTISIFVQLDPTSTDQVTVEYLTLAGTASAGVDYIQTTGVLTFTAGTASQSFKVTITDDTVDEPDESVNLILRNPKSAGAVALGVDTATLIIRDNDPPPTATPTPTTGAPPVYVDGYEPNDTLNIAFETAADAADLCDNTLWPTGDLDFFKFRGKPHSAYTIYTSNLDVGLDTALTVYNPQGVVIASNDDISALSLASSVSINTNSDGYYYARVVNKDPSDPADKTYCFEVDEINPPTATPTVTRVPGADSCEYNGTFETACQIGSDTSVSLNFVPSVGYEVDNDFFKLWMKPNILYTCETNDLSGLNDTNMIIYDQNRNAIAGNDDKELGDFGSEVQFYSTYTGWLYILVGPAVPIEYENSSQYTYKLICNSLAATLTPVPTSTPTATPVSVFTGPFATSTPAVTATPFVFPTFPPSPTPIDFSVLTPQATTAPPVVVFEPLPTATPATGSQQVSSINITLYYDNNNNYMPELTEGIIDVAVALYDNSTGQLIAFGYTNDAGLLSVNNISTAGAVRVVVPFLNYSQLVVGQTSNILLRVAPQPLPVGIP